MWTPRGGKVYEDMGPFEFTTNETYDYYVVSPRTIEQPQTSGAAASVVWSYSSNNTTFANVTTWPLSMIAGSVLRATVTGLAAGAKRLGAAKRIL